MFSIVRASVYKNPFIGLYFKASDGLLLAARNAPAKTVELAEEVLRVRSVRLFVRQSPLVGVFAAMNSTGVVLSDSAEAEERALLKKEGLNVCTLKAFAPGNNVLCNDKAALLNPAIHPSDARRIGDCLGVEVFQQPITSRGVVGSLNVVTNKGLLAFNEVTDVEFKRLIQIFGVHGARGTSNMGSVCNAFGVVANTNGALVGQLTSGFEVQRVYEALS
ncbi:MAG: translation initiation factor IF-6 [Candidatus Micrarchaeia archaeon]|jgi:translation initiation factor 6